LIKVGWNKLINNFKILIIVIKINTPRVLFIIFNFNLLLCICYRSRDFVIYQSFRYYIIYSTSVTNRYTHVRIQLYCKAAAFACVNTKQTVWTCLIFYMSNFIVTYSIRHPSCANEHRCAGGLCITRRIIVFLIYMNPTVIFVAWSRYWNRGTLSNAASLIKLSVEYWI